MTNFASLNGQVGWIYDFNKLNRKSNTAINFKQILQLLRWHWYKRKVMSVVVLRENDVYINYNLLSQ